MTEKKFIVGVLRNPNGDYSSINPRIGLLYDVREDAGIYANVSWLYEPPTNFELEDNVAGGDATLDAMEGTVVEVGMRGSREFGTASSFSWDLSLYVANHNIRNIAAPDDEILNPGAPLSAYVGVHWQLR